MLSRKRKKSLSIARAIKMAQKEEMEDGELQIEIDLDNIEIESNKHSDNLIHNSFLSKSSLPLDDLVCVIVNKNTKTKCVKKLGIY
jgi:hypothetical protein